MGDELMKTVHDILSVLYQQGITSCFTEEKNYIIAAKAELRKLIDNLELGPDEINTSYIKGYYDAKESILKLFT